MRRDRPSSSAEPVQSKAKRAAGGHLLDDNGHGSPNSGDGDLADDAKSPPGIGQQPDSAPGPTAKADPLEANLGMARGELLQLAEGVTSYVTKFHRENPDEPPTSESCYPAYDLLLRIYRQAERFSQVEVKLRAVNRAKERHCAQVEAVGRGRQDD